MPDTVTVALEAPLVQAAEARGLDVAAVAAAALRHQIAAHDAEAWLAANAAALAVKAQQVNEQGLWCDEFRLF